MSSGHPSPAALAVSLVEEPGAARNAAELGIATERKRIADWLRAEAERVRRRVGPTDPHAITAAVALEACAEQLS